MVARRRQGVEPETMSCSLLDFLHAQLMYDVSEVITSFECSVTVGLSRLHYNSCVLPQSNVFMDSD